MSNSKYHQCSFVYGYKSPKPEFQPSTRVTNSRRRRRLSREFRLEETAEFQAEVRTPRQKGNNTFWSILYNELNATQAVTGPGACVIKVQTPMDDVTGTLRAVLKMLASLFRIERAKASKKKCSRSYLQQRQRISRHDTNLWNLIKHILTSSLNCYWTDALQHAIYLFSYRPYK